MLYKYEHIASSFCTLAGKFSYIQKCTLVNASLDDTRDTKSMDVVLDYYTNLHQFGVAFYDFLWFFVNLWKIEFGLTKGFVGIYRETLGFINLLEYGNA